ASRECRCSFFCQADGGIRDFHVTGVQTCALPICLAALAPGETITLEDLQVLQAPVAAPPVAPASAAQWDLQLRQWALDCLRAGRSEERRAGKECSCAWSPDQSANESDGSAHPAET